MSGLDRSRLEQDVLQRTPEQMVPLLYQHLLGHLRDAAACLDADDAAGRAHHADRALAILFELMDTLDLDRGGELAARLSALYSYFATVIIELGRSHDVDLLRRVMDMVAMLHHSWERAASSTVSTTR